MLGPTLIRQHLAGLSTHLRGKGFSVEETSTGILVRDPNRRGPGVRISCRERPSDGDHLWFWDARGPLAEVEHIADATIAIRGQLNQTAPEGWL